MKHILRAFFLLFFCAAANIANAQEMADTMRDNGKIYVVVAVMATIFAGLFTYLIYLDIKLRRIERQRNTALRN